MRNTRIMTLTETALAVALSLVLNFIQIRLPVNLAGGSISLVMLPIVVVALRRGPVAGAVAGLLFGTLDFIIEPYIVHWAQVFLDYPLPYLLFGLGAGLFKGLRDRAVESKRTGAATCTIVAAMVCGGALRFFMHLLSGVIFFSSSTPVGQNVWLWSAAYQCTYLLPSLVGVCILACIIMPILDHAVPAR